MSRPQATVIVVPRERFSFTQRSLESILQRTDDLELIYVDGNSPPETRRYLERQADRHGFHLIRYDRFLAPNVARNIALQHVRTPYVAFVDNDVLVASGWLNRLVDCAEETGAWVVGPLYCQGEPEGKLVHMAGGTASIKESGGQRWFEEQHTHLWKPLAEVRPTLRRCETELVEYHTLLMRMDVCERFGPLDEGLLSHREHCDLCLLVREAGEKVILEPDAVITYVGPLPQDDYDREFFLLRWCEAWNVMSLDRFCEKWQLSGDDPRLDFSLHWCGSHRRKRWSAWKGWKKRLGHKWHHWLDQKVAVPLDRALSLWRHPLADCRPGGRFDGGTGMVRPPCTPPRDLHDLPPRVELAKAA